MYTESRQDAKYANILGTNGHHNEDSGSTSDDMQS